MIVAPLPPTPPDATRRPLRGLALGRHAMVACVIAALATASMAFGLDDAIARSVFDVATASFPARDSELLELFGHRLAKSALWIVWFVLLGVSLAAGRLSPLAPYRRVLWATTVAFALGPLAVSLLKSVTGPRCPWDLIEFGGAWEPALQLFTGTSGAGRCFPSGHASGGYALMSLYFAGKALGDARIRAAGLWLGLIAGTVCGAVRIAQGAHFLSHNLWAAAVVWTVSALVFAIACPPDAPRGPSR
jgi:membrane-associated PAP2 superfamily phosphatase